MKRCDIITNMARKKTKIVNDTKAVAKTPSELVHDFLKENKLKIKVSAEEGLNVWVGDGYVLNDKPLLKITYVKDN